jgi:hypothetical protein
LFFPDECPTPSTQDEIIEIVDQAKLPNWHEATVSAKIYIFEMDYESAISYFVRLDNLDKIRRTNGPAPTVAADNNTFLTNSLGIGNVRKKHKTKLWCHCCDKNNHNTDDCR